MSLPTVALFRARDDAQRTAAALARRGAAAAIAPAAAFRALNPSPPQGGFDFAVATSARAIEFAPPPALALIQGLPLHMVGERTAAAARRAGLLQAAPAAADVAALLPLLPQGRALYLAGRDRRPELEAALAGRVEALVVYEARARARWSEAEALEVGAAAAALHYSERSAALAAQLAERAGLAAWLRRIPHVCLSREVAAPLAAFGVSRALWPRAPEEEALLDTLESALADYGL